MTTRREFFSQKRREILYKTIEIYHPTTGVKRYVRRQQLPKSLTLESTAPRNAGETVSYEGGEFLYELPKQDDSTITAEVQFGQVGRIFKQELKKIKGVDRAKTGELIIREWIKGETDPVFVLQLYISSITMEPNGCVILATQDDPSDKQVSEIFTTARFPGLAESL